MRRVDRSYGETQASPEQKWLSAHIGLWKPLNLFFPTQDPQIVRVPLASRSPDNGASLQ